VNNVQVVQKCIAFNTLQHTAEHCNTLRHTATPCKTLQHTSTHCNRLRVYAGGILNSVQVMFKYIDFNNMQHIIDYVCVHVHVRVCVCACVCARARACVSMQEAT